ncbi:MAG: thiamine phosphate synthase [Candidatus Omnitrophica bacterium]|nr:thiamine phosphate synthase [Candidatus Omnitrophota bacterium]
MPLKKKLLNESNLYVILDAQVNTYEELFEIVKKSVGSGVDILQLRDKISSAKKVLEFSRKIVEYINHKLLFIVNDRVDIALLSGADGVHVGQNDISAGDVRRLTGKNFLIGTSAQRLEHCRAAEEAGADYIGLGSVYKTKTKPERCPMDQTLLTEVARSIQIPVFAIGGIDQTNVRQIVDKGLKRVAVCRSLCCSDNFLEEVSLLKKILRG